MKKTCRNCGQTYRSEYNHQCSDDGTSILDTAIDIGVAVALSSMFDSDSSSSSSDSDSSFDGFDGGSFGGGGASSDF